MSCSKQPQGFTDEQKEDGTSCALPLSVEFQALRKVVEPCSGKDSGTGREPKIRLKVIDMENGETRICDLERIERMGLE